MSSSLMSRSQLKRQKMKLKLAAQRAAEEEAKADQEPKTGDDVTVSEETDQESEAERVAAERIREIEEEAARQEEKNKTWDPNAKVFRGAVGADTQAEAIKVARQVSMVTEGEMGAGERARLSALVGSGKNQEMKTYVRQNGVTAVATDVTPKSTLVFSHCTDCNYTVDDYCAKIFVQDCENLTLTVNGKVMTETIEVHQCVGTRVFMYSKIGTVQIDQSRDCGLVYGSRELFGNGSMIRKDREFGNDGMVIWAGCDNLSVTVGADETTGDYEAALVEDATVHRERTQFKIHYNALNQLVSEKVMRLVNGFPTTKREDDEHTRREEAAMVELADRMGITMNRKASSVGARVKPNEPCTCGSGKKYKKCCRT